MNHLKDKTIIIIGATSGLGEAMAHKFKPLAKRLILTGRNQDKLNQLSKELGDENLYLELDLESQESIKSFANKINSLDEEDYVLICNAGIWLEGETSNEDLDKIQRVIATDLTGHMQLTSLLIPKLKELGKGQIVFINSVAGLDYNPGNSFYSAAKFGLTGFAKTIQSELVDFNIKVSSIHPGGMDTDLFNRAGNNYGKASWMMEKEDMADVVLRVIDQPDNMVIDQISIRTFPENILRYADSE